MRFINFAIGRLARFRAAIVDLLERDYPFPDSRLALELLAQSAEILTSELKSARHASEEMQRTLAERTLEEVYSKLPILGLIGQSGDVVGPVEFHGPFRRLIQKILDGDPKLVMSSDWDYSPYTYIYPGLFPGHQYVIVALPYSEVGQVLVLPIAGHELGHNLWQHHALSEGYSIVLAKTIDELRLGPFKDLYGQISSESSTESGTEDLFGMPPLWHESLKMALAQSEELFCDFFGIALFGRSYLAAFEYLTSPWSFPRVSTYPSMVDRIYAQLQFAKQLGIEVPSYFSSPGLSSNPEFSVLLQIADVATSRHVQELMGLALQYAAPLLSQASDAEIERISNCFKFGRPATGVKCISDILNAAWVAFDFQSDDVGLDLINEVALKTLEVFEIDWLQSKMEEPCFTQARLVN